jgi:Fe-S cluster assembly scaffold protein SufB
LGRTPFSSCRFARYCFTTTAPKNKKQQESIEDVDPELRATFEKLGIPLDEQKRLANVAVDAVILIA